MLAGRFAILNSMKIELPPFLTPNGPRWSRRCWPSSTPNSSGSSSWRRPSGNCATRLPSSKAKSLDPRSPQPPGNASAQAAAGTRRKRPGSAKRSKKASFVTPIEVTIPFPDPPPGSISKGYEEYFVQELVIQAKVTRYRRERFLTPDGQTLLAPLPDEVLPGSHFGPTLCFILHQYHHRNVTQPLLLEQLHDLGIDISAGQLSRILTESKDAFHQEKAEVLPAGLETASYLGVDDTGARHKGKNGFCTAIGNDLFAYFESTDSKSRLNFLRCCGGPHRLHDQRGDGGLLAAAEVGPGGDRATDAGPQQFADEAAWQAVAALGITVSGTCGSPPKGRCWGS